MNNTIPVISPSQKYWPSNRSLNETEESTHTTYLPHSSSSRETSQRVIEPSKWTTLDQNDVTCTRPEVWGNVIESVAIHSLQHSKKGWTVEPSPPEAQALWSNSKDRVSKAIAKFFAQEQALHLFYWHPIPSQRSKIREASATEHASFIYNTHLLGSKTVFDTVIGSLSRLKDVDEIPTPRKEVIRDIKAIESVLSQIKLFPLTEIDDDGSVSLRWSNQNYCFSLTFNGNRKLIGTLVPSAKSYLPWKLDVSSELAIAEKFDHQTVRLLVG